jgi:hypothetical protein
MMNRAVLIACMASGRVIKKALKYVLNWKRFNQARGAAANQGS